MQVRIDEIVVYPIKSLRGVSLRSTPVEWRGLKHDRRWMLVDPEGVFITIRKNHNLVLFDTEIRGTGIRVSLTGRAPLDVPFKPEGELRTVHVWNDPLEAIRVSDCADEWFSDALGMSCSLVYMPEDKRRQSHFVGSTEEDIVGFADTNPILVAGTSSIDDLNSRLAVPISIRRFRPNIVVSGAAAFEEDTWAGMSIGDVSLRKSRHCARCAVPTVDIETAKSSDEPLRTLNSYRKRDGHVWFGTFYTPDSLGTISVGDEIVTQIDQNL